MTDKSEDFYPKSDEADMINGKSLQLMRRIFFVMMERQP